MRRVAPLLLLALACSDPDEQVLDSAREEGRREGQAAGYQEGYAVGLREGHAEGVERGRREGAQAARDTALARWTPVGLGLGLVLGLALAALVARRPLAAELARRRRERALEALLGPTPRLSFDPEVYQQALELARRSRTLRDELRLDPAPTVRELAERLEPKLGRLDRQIIELSRLLQRLRETQRAVPVEPEALRAAIEVREAEQAAADPETATALGQVIAAERRKLAAHERTVANRRRVELKLDALSGFLDHARIAAANLQALDRDDALDALDAEVGQEVDELEATLRTARAELATL